MPFISVRLLRQVIEKGSSGRQAVFASHSRRVGFPVLLPVSCVRRIEHRLTAKQFSIQSLAAALQAKRVQAKAAEILNINTPEELQNARKIIRAG
jgi:CTP:molybdopterin cytidylyltransferase MocA